MLKIDGYISMHIYIYVYIYVKPNIQADILPKFVPSGSHRGEMYWLDKAHRGNTSWRHVSSIFDTEKYNLALYHVSIIHAILSFNNRLDSTSPFLGQINSISNFSYSAHLCHCVFVTIIHMNEGSLFAILHTNFLR